MCLWRVTCPQEERYVVAPSFSEAMAVADRRWARERETYPVKYALTRIDLVSTEDPWLR